MFHTSVGSNLFTAFPDIDILLGSRLNQKFKGRYITGRYIK